MNIAIIANGYPTCREPQYGCFERDQAVGLLKYGHKVTIIYVDGRFRKYWRKIGITHLSESDIDVFGLFLFPTALFSRLNYKLDYYIRKYLLNQVFSYMLKKCERPDIIYAHFLNNISYAAFLKEKYNIPLVGMEHWSVLSQTTLPLDVMYRGKIAYQKADQIIAVSNSLKTQIYKHFQRSVSVVHNMLGYEFIQKPIYIKRRTETFKFVAIGSLISRKGFDVLISAFEKSRLTEQCCEVIIIGDGIEKKNLYMQIEDLGLTNYITLVGHKNKFEIIDYLKNSDVFVLSSRAETFGVVCIEALSLGIPIIATECGGPEEFVRNENGILIKPNDVDALAIAMKQLYENYYQYDHNYISSDCIQRFGPAVIAKQITDIFDEILVAHHCSK